MTCILTWWICGSFLRSPCAAGVTYTSFLLFLFNFFFKGKKKKEKKKRKKRKKGKAEKPRADFINFIVVNNPVSSCVDFWPLSLLEPVRCDQPQLHVSVSSSLSSGHDLTVPARKAHGRVRERKSKDPAAPTSPYIIRLMPWWLLWGGKKGRHLCGLKEFPVLTLRTWNSAGLCSWWHPQGT